MKKLAVFFLLLACGLSASAWGFFAHRRINRMAVFTLPPELFSFYKYHLRFIEENAVNADRRRYAVEGEAAHHYIDLDAYGDSALHKLPRRWNDAVEKFSEDTLLKYGTVPWHINAMRYRLTEAFRERNVKKILLHSTDLGHYIADAHVPLHTTQNYNGQLTGQHGIHGFWESRLPELYSDNYNFFFARARYLDSPLESAWQAVASANAALDSVLRMERELTLKFGEDRKYSFEERNGLPSKVYAQEFALAYHKVLNGQVERQMRASIQMIGNFWFTCWVDAGQPDLAPLMRPLNQVEQQELEREMEEWKKVSLRVRNEED